MPMFYITRNHDPAARGTMKTLWLVDRLPLSPAVMSRVVFSVSIADDLCVACVR